MHWDLLPIVVLFLVAGLLILAPFIFLGLALRRYANRLAQRHAAGMAGIAESVPSTDIARRSQARRVAALAKLQCWCRIAQSIAIGLIILCGLAVLVMASCAGDVLINGIGTL